MAYVDGARTLTAPIDRPYLMQLTASAGQVLWTGYLEAGHAPPDWQTLDIVLPTPLAELPAPDERTRSKPLLIGGGLALAAAGGLYAVAGVWRNAYDDLDNPNVQTTDDLSALRARTNAAVIGSGGLAVVGLGLGTLGLIELRF